ncbi:MAG: PKD domain-containing protein [Thermoplasmata archaeon]|nr:PKD domain-containing protein [Thermoplasmata archaeon]
MPHPAGSAGPSAPAAPATLSPAGPSAAARPAAPTLGVDGATPSAIALSWVANGGGGFVNYSVASSTVGPSGPWQVDGVLTSQSTTSWSTGSLAPGVSLWWQVTENTCVIFCGSSASNVVAVAQPALAALNFTLPSGSSANFNWTNNGTYGGLLGFVSYGLYERVSGGAPNLVASISTVATHSFTATGLSGGLGYTFYLNTTDCYSGCGTGSALLAVGSSNSVTFGVPVSLSVSVSDVRAVVDTGQSDLFSCNPSGGRAPYTFAWDFGNGTSLPGPASESQSYASSGSPTIQCVVTDAASTQATSATTVTVNPAPVLNLSANTTGVDVGQPIGLTGTVTLGTPLLSVAWAFGDGQTGSGPTLSHSYATAGHPTITCSATDATTTTVVRTLAVNVSPRLAVSGSTSSSTGAPGTALTFSAVAHNGSGSFSRYAWTFGDGSKATGASESHAFATAGGFNATILVTDSNGAANSSTVRVVISAIAVQVATTPASGTTKDSFAFSAVATGGAGGPYNVTWNFGDGTHAYGATTTHRYASAATFRATVVVADRLGATNTTSLPSLTVTTPPAAPPLVPSWGIALIAILAALLLGFFLVRRYRRQQSAALRSAAPWAPPTDPSRTLRGRKSCPTCGTSNLPIRETCENCGSDLPRRALTG